MKSRWQLMYHRAFDVGIVLKGLDGLFEVVAGAILLLTSHPTLLGIAHWLTRAELIEDPDDFLANHLLHLAQKLSIGSWHFAGAYLLGHGMVKLGLVIGLWRGARWAYPTAMAVLTAFIAYQCYRWLHHASVFLALLTVMDAVIVLLIGVEWSRRSVAAGRPAVTEGHASR
ncbi:MAG: DUF2127 domain-containing protein [Rhodanobacter sp.]